MSISYEEIKKNNVLTDFGVQDSNTKQPSLQKNTSIKGKDSTKQLRFGIMF